MCHKELRIHLWEVLNVFEIKKVFQVPKYKIDEISLPFFGGGPRITHLEFSVKIPNNAKKC